jgi:hypothetical protein
MSFDVSPTSDTVGVKLLSPGMAIERPAAISPAFCAASIANEHLGGGLGPPAGINGSLARGSQMPVPANGDTHPL